jgi:hypothetical protein
MATSKRKPARVQTKKSTPRKPSARTTAFARLLVHGDRLCDEVGIFAPAKRLDLADPQPDFTGQANGGVPLFTLGLRP